MTTRARLEGGLIALVLTTMTTTTGCVDPELPEAWVWTPPPAGKPDQPCSIDTVADDDAVEVWHRLPPEIHTEQPLTIEARTPCTTTTTTVHHAPDDDGDVARATLRAPPGSSCGLVVTLTIANDVQTCERPTGDCEDLSAQCDELEPSASSSGTDSTGEPTSSGTGSD